MGLKLRFVGIIAVALTCLVSATAAGTAEASEVSNVPVIAWLYGTSGRTLGGQTTIGGLESGSCPLNTPQAAPEQYGPGGSPEPAPQSPTQQQWAVITLLTNSNCLGMSLSSINEVQILTSSSLPQQNASATLTTSDLTAPNGPLIWDAGSTVGYVRPSRSPTDDNSADALTFLPGNSVVFNVYIDGAAPQQLTVTASPTTAAVNSPITFTVQSQGQALPAGETYSWSFSDGGPGSTQASPTTTFPDAGTWNVTVQVTGPVNGYGSIPVTVGSPQPTKGTKTTKTGPAKSKGKTPGGSPGTKKKVAPVVVKPKPKPKPKAKPKPTLTPTAKPKPKKKPAKKKQHTTTTTTAVAPSSTPPSGGTGGGTGATAAHGAGATKTPVAPTSPVLIKVVTKHHRRPTIAPKPPAAPKRHGTLVSGRSLGAIEPLSGSAQKLAQDLSPTTSPSAPPLSQPSGPGPWALIGGIAAILVILGLGAGSELRHVRSVP